jgi:UDP-2,4-diacetamido-2,4,6-trideoxy-beta-L-altropyranose hydrolase
MYSVSTPPSGGRVAFRCDGDEQIGAGHVARCLPLAGAFAQLGWSVGFVGTYDGLAAWLLTRAGVAVQAPDDQAGCGIAPAAWDAAVVDSYVIPSTAICDLSRALPVVTLAEANRCPTSGILVDYHLDRTEAPDSRLLAGPSFAPIDPAFAGAGRAGDEIRSVLVTVGGSLAARQLLAALTPIVSAIFPDADVLVAGGPLEPTATGGISRVISLPSSGALIDAVSEIDLTVTGAGFTAYEMACAGIPFVAIAIAENQRRVLRGLRSVGLAPGLDLTGGDSLAELPAVLLPLHDPELRRGLAERGRTTFDGMGARRAAIALVERFGAAGATREDARTASDAGS